MQKLKNPAMLGGRANGMSGCCPYESMLLGETQQEPFFSRRSSPIGPYFSEQFFCSVEYSVNTPEVSGQIAEQGAVRACLVEHDRQCVGNGIFGALF